MGTGGIRKGFLNQKVVEEHVSKPEVLEKINSKGAQIKEFKAFIVNAGGTQSQTSRCTLSNGKSFFIKQTPDLEQVRNQQKADEVIKKIFGEDIKSCPFVLMLYSSVLSGKNGIIIFPEIKGVMLTDAFREGIDRSVFPIKKIEPKIAISRKAEIYQKIGIALGNIHIIGMKNAGQLQHFYENGCDLKNKDILVHPDFQASNILISESGSIHFVDTDETAIDMHDPYKNLRDFHDMGLESKKSKIIFYAVEGYLSVFKEEMQHLILEKIKEDFAKNKIKLTEADFPSPPIKSFSFAESPSPIVPSENMKINQKKESVKGKERVPEERSTKLVTKPIASSNSKILNSNKESQSSKPKTSQRTSIAQPSQSPPKESREVKEKNNNQLHATAEKAFQNIKKEETNVPKSTPLDFVENALPDSKQFQKKENETPQVVERDTEKMLSENLTSQYSSIGENAVIQSQQAKAEVTERVLHGDPEKVKNVTKSQPTIIEKNVASENKASPKEETKKSLPTNRKAIEKKADVPGPSTRSAPSSVRKPLSENSQRPAISNAKSTNNITNNNNLNLRKPISATQKENVPPKQAPISKKVENPEDSQNPTVASRKEVNSKASVHVSDAVKFFEDAASKSNLQTKKIEPLKRQAAQLKQADQSKPDEKIATLPPKGRKAVEEKVRPRKVEEEKKVPQEVAEGAKKDQDTQQKVRLAASKNFPKAQVKREEVEFPTAKPPKESGKDVTEQPFHFAEPVHKERVESPEDKLRKNYLQQQQPASRFPDADESSLNAFFSDRFSGGVEDIENKLRAAYESQNTERNTKKFFQWVNIKIGNVRKERDQQIKGLAQTIHKLREDENLPLRFKAVLLQAHLCSLNLELSKEDNKFHSRLEAMTKDMENRMHEVTGLDMNKELAIKLSSAYNYKRNNIDSVQNVLIEYQLSKPKP